MLCCHHFNLDKLLFFSYITLYLNGTTRHCFLTRDNYISVYHRKKTLCPFYKIVKNSFERCLATSKNKICTKDNETITNFKNFWFPSLIDIQMSCFALIQTSWIRSSNHANVRSKYLTLHNQVLRAETTYVQCFRSVNLLLTPLCPWAHRAVRQGNMGALLIRPLCLQHIYRAMRWISQLGHSVYLPSK